jgi:hypothetical protein
MIDFFSIFFRKDTLKTQKILQPAKTFCAGYPNNFRTFTLPYLIEAQSQKDKTMAVTYVLTQKGNPGDSTAPEKFYAPAKAREELTFCKLSKEIAEGSTTVSDSDVLAVLNAFTSTGAETAEKFNASLIKSGKVTFRPGVDLKEILCSTKRKNKIVILCQKK